MHSQLKTTHSQDQHYLSQRKRQLNLRNIATKKAHTLNDASTCLQNDILTDLREYKYTRESLQLSLYSESFLELLPSIETVMTLLSTSFKSF